MRSPSKAPAAHRGPTSRLNHAHRTRAIRRVGMVTQAVLAVLLIAVSGCCAKLA